MVVVARPSIMSAVVSRIRSFSEILAFVQTAAGDRDARSDRPRVATEIRDYWLMPTHAVWVKARGGPQSDEQLGLLNQRVDVWCYGQNDYEAERLNRIVMACLCPDQGQHLVSFIVSNTRVYDVRSEALGFSDVDTERGGNWPYYWQPVVFKYGSQPTA